jgi:hypothetical protein
VCVVSLIPSPEAGAEPFGLCAAATEPNDVVSGPVGHDMAIPEKGKKGSSGGSDLRN